MTSHGQHFDLGPPRPTDKDRYCACAGEEAIKLMTALSYQPIRCVACNRQVPVKTLPFGVDLLREIGYWRWIYDALYRLWLDSEDYEAWALGELSDITSRANQLGLQLLEDIRPIRQCYYWLFQDESDEAFEPLADCPLCGRGRTPFARGTFPQLVCEPCALLLSDGG